MQGELNSSFPTLPYSEEQGERFHQDVRDIERRYQGRWDVNMLADYYWMLRRETQDGLCTELAYLLVMIIKTFDKEINENESSPFNLIIEMIAS
ncbi:hypothetical protein AVEN_92469-1 [Araneus ventricosus]|uniref:Uncharacterized protein n=1 Tax=Araneus ventricosus TaxID=182803 RepID=A0A4Y2AI02_ARAVE|nr:hypothetical protein AVEN_92469-1 [Araneus ventricosus]